MDGNQDQSAAEERLLTEALAAYSDACTLPALTPTCPFFRVVNDFPTCENECIDLIGSRGQVGRSIGEISLGGLVLTGRTLPLHAAGTSDGYDAMRDYIEQRGRGFSEQSTGTLLLGLGVGFNKAPRQPASDELMVVHEIWAELERRELPVESVVRAAIIPQVATQIAMLCITPLMTSSKMWDELVSDDELSRLGERAAAWAEVLQRSFDQDSGHFEIDYGAPLADFERASRSLEEIFRLHPLDESSSMGTDDLDPPDINRDTLRRAANPRVRYALSSRFTNRIVHWLNRLLADDLSAVVGWAAPPVAVFAALPSTPPIEEAGLWIWDRYTRTSLGDWSTSSLIREWAGNDDGELNLRVWLERRCDPDQVAALALSRLTEKAVPALAPPTLSAENFASAASRHLAEGRADEAAEIFQGLAELNPTDGDVLNNLGFCLLATDPERALTVLQRSSLYPMSQRKVNAANRVLALVLVGRVDDALGLALESTRLPLAEDQHSQCWAWEITQDGDKHQIALQLTTPEQYLDDLVSYISQSSAGGTPTKS